MSVLAACLALVACVPALASVAEMRALVAQRPELVHHWTFEGAYLRECLADKQGGLPLRGIRFPDRAHVTPPLDQHGPDNTSRCMRIVREGSKAGVVAETSAAIRFEREGTVELLFRADSVTPGEFEKGWMLHTSSGQRLYLAGVSHVRDVDEVICGFGSGQPFHPKAEVVIARQGAEPSFEPARWHYLAVTFSHFRQSGEFTINAYFAPLGAPGAELAHAVKDAKRPGGRAPLGERFLHFGSAGPEQVFDGLIDEVAVYDRPLSLEVLREHFAALTRPPGDGPGIDLSVAPQAPLFQVDEALAARHADAYTDEWKHTSPDLVVYLPDGQKGPRAENQHFIVFPLTSGEFFAVWTSAFSESHPNQHIVFSKSPDRGVTWTEPATIAGPRATEENGETKYEGLASWGFPIYVPDKGRIYVFYNKSIGLFDPNRGSTGEMRFVYTDDDGTTWSDEYTVAMRRTATMAPDPGIPPNWIIWQQPVEITPGQVIGCGTIWASGRLAKEQPDALVGSECWFWRFDNILTEDDPGKIRVTMLPDGDHGIRMPNAEGSRASTAEEPTIVRLSDGRWFCVFRTYRGCVGYAVSEDEGHSWSEARPLRYRDGGDIVRQPTASCPLYALSDGRFLLTFHNNDGTANGGRHPWDWRYNRTPAFYSVGAEMLDQGQPVWFTRPIMLLDNEARPWGPVGRRSVAVYTSFFERDGTRRYWYPDRKHFLLGKFVTDEMLGATRPASRLR